ncbi:hypothetical protein CBM2634_B140084 [Cupriavidus taiwanensis]|uniref:Uncharacterized protein n=1 Tax=Cupriavidus taiwanensis TaxID=164546 RepID=A0A375J5X6_9BURK|nr:hypothetical protein CBM2634_B140084 [Cupriavidus taiwanensis]
MLCIKPQCHSTANVNQPIAR